MLLKFPNEYEWLEARKKDVSSTEVSSLFGLNPYQTRLKLWLNKAGLSEPEFIETEAMRWGKRLQNTVGKGICEDNGWDGEDLNLIYFRDEESRLGASMDFLVMCPDRGKGILETKITDSFSPELGWHKDTAPLHYEIQLNTQLNLAVKEYPDISWGAIAALGSRHKARIYYRVPDLNFGKIAREETKKFWQSIENNQPPEPDYLHDADILNQILPTLRHGETKNLTPDHDALELADMYAKLQVRSKRIGLVNKRLNAKMTEVQSRLLMKIGNAEIVRIGNHKISARTQKVEPRVTDGYEFRRFDFSTSKKGA